MDNLKSITRCLNHVVKVSDLNRHGDPMVIPIRGGELEAKEVARQLIDYFSNDIDAGPCTEDGGMTWDVYVVGS